MTSPPAPRLHDALLALALLCAACGRLAAPGSEGSDAPGPSPSPVENFIPNGGRIGDPEMLTSPIFMPWDGGDPTWSLSREESDDIILEFTMGGGHPERVVDWMPEACYPLDEGGEGPSFSTEDCFYPALRRLVGDDALRFYIESEGSMVLGLAGAGSVKVADIWWGPYGSNDYPEALILTPQGFMSSSPNEWAPYARAEEEASTQDVLRRIIDATGEGGPYYFNHVYAWQIHAPVEDANGWSIATTAHLIGGCHACDVEFGGRFTLTFSEAGTPTDASFDGYCYFDYVATDNPNADAAAIAALRAELPICEPARPGESVIDWQNPSQWQG